MAKQVQTQQQALEQTEYDLASAIQVIQEKELELTQVKEELAQAKTQSKPYRVALTEDDADNSGVDNRSSRAGFGAQFPSNPNKGDLFLRVDMLPNKLYKWNGLKWIEIDKNTTDRLTYETQYIMYLKEKLLNREMGLDDLSTAEVEQVMGILNYNEKMRIR